MSCASGSILLSVRIPGVDGGINFLQPGRRLLRSFDYSANISNHLDDLAYDFLKRLAGVTNQGHAALDVFVEGVDEFLDRLCRLGRTLCRLSNFLSNDSCRIGDV